jgi:hypothetical protein
VPDFAKIKQRPEKQKNNTNLSLIPHVKFGVRIKAFRGRASILESKSPRDQITKISRHAFAFYSPNSVTTRSHQMSLVYLCLRTSYQLWKNLRPVPTRGDGFFAFWRPGRKPTHVLFIAIQWVSNPELAASQSSTLQSCSRQRCDRYNPKKVKFR